LEKKFGQKRGGQTQPKEGKEIREAQVWDSPGKEEILNSPRGRGATKKREGGFRIREKIKE